MVPPSTALVRWLRAVEASRVVETRTGDWSGGGEEARRMRTAEGPSIWREGRKGRGA